MHDFYARIKENSLLLNESGRDELEERLKRARDKLQKPKKTSDGSSTDYYKIPEGSVDLIDLIEFKNMNFAVGNIFKACYRLGQKEGNDDAYDLRKIIFFAERELKRIGAKQ